MQTLTFGIVGPATSIATDMTEGIVDRLRSLPTARSAFLIGHLISDLGSSMLALVIMTISGLIVGWRIESDVPQAIGGFALLILFSFTMLWIGMLLGLLARAPDAVTGVAFIVIFPLTFVANTFVPTAEPARRRCAWSPNTTRSARSPPGSARCSATRRRCPSNPPWPLQHPVLASVLWCLLEPGPRDSR